MKKWKTPMKKFFIIFFIIFFIGFCEFVLCQIQNETSKDVNLLESQIFVTLTSSNGDLLDSGFTTLKWKLSPEIQNQPINDNIIYELYRSEDPQFLKSKKLYKGRDLATFISGLLNGVYYFQVHALSDQNILARSTTLKLKVKHHSFRLAFTLFGLGALAFFCIVGVLINGHRKFKY